MVNCSGYDTANGCYYKDSINNKFINVRNPKLSIIYINNNKIGNWIIIDSSFEPPQTIYKSPPTKPCFNYSCIPCCEWEKICQTTGDPPQISALDYYNVTNPKYTMSYSTFQNSWGLFNKFNEIGYGVSNNYIIVRTNTIDGAYQLNGSEFKKILDPTIIMSYNGTSWEIKQGLNILYTNPNTISTVPPFDKWVKVGGTGDIPLVLNTILPSGITWYLL